MESLKSCSENGSVCGFWTFFLKVATSDVDDVREVLSYYRQFDDPIEAFR